MYRLNIEQVAAHGPGATLCAGHQAAGISDWEVGLHPGCCGGLLSVNMIILRSNMLLFPITAK